MILVTGGAGYIGSVTVELLRERGERGVVLDNLSRGHRPTVPADVPFYQEDIGDRALITRLANKHPIDACVHFAAFAYVGESVLDPARYFENNVGQGVAFLGALRDAVLSLFSALTIRRRTERRCETTSTYPTWEQRTILR
jgi:UDP-glucose 4-epimerase